MSRQKKSYKTQIKEQTPEEILSQTIEHVNTQLTLLPNDSLFCTGVIDTPLVNVDGKYITYPFQGPMTNFENVIQKAPFGMGEKTLIDDKIRTGWQINPEHVKFYSDILNSLKNPTNPIIFEIHKIIASQHQGIYAEFYKMLIYGQGGHFKRHKDTQRSKDHFGTLIFFLPGDYEGGEFILSTSKDYSFSNSFSKDPQIAKTSWLAFYTDLDHELLPVTKGYRLALTFNLFVNQEKPYKVLKVEKDKKTHQKPFKNELQSILSSNHFNKMLYVLSYKYTPSTLEKQYLKGHDYHLYSKLCDDFMITIVPLYILDGFQDEDQFTTYKFDFHGQKFEINAPKYRFTDKLADGEFEFFNKWFVHTPFPFPQMDIINGNFFPMGNDGGSAELQYQHAGMVIVPKTKPKVVLKRTNIRFKFL